MLNIVSVRQHSVAHLKVLRDGQSFTVGKSAWMQIDYALRRAAPQKGVSNTISHWFPTVAYLTEVIHALDIRTDESWRRQVNGGTGGTLPQYGMRHEV